MAHMIDTILGEKIYSLFGYILQIFYNMKEHTVLLSLDTLLVLNIPSILLLIQYLHQSWLINKHIFVHNALFLMHSVEIRKI